MQPLWFDKVDDALRCFHSEKNTGLVDCLIWTDDVPAIEVESIIRREGGRVGHRVEILPGVTAALSASALGTVASSPHVLQVEAAVGYMAF